MRATGSIRTATRWWWSEARTLTRAVAFAATAGAIGALGACVTTTQTFYRHTEGESRFSLDEARAVLDQVVASECFPRLVEAGKDVSRDGLLELDVDGTGAVTQARVAKTLGDARLDAAFGGVAARLQIDAPPAGTPTGAVGHIKAGYACGGPAGTGAGTGTATRAAVAMLEPVP